jgi:hypothetical protein
VPDEHAVELLELRKHFGGKVVSVDRRFRGHVAVPERFEQCREAARLRVREVARLASARIQDRNPSNPAGLHADVV